MLLGVLLKRRLWRSSSGSDGGDAGGDPIMVYTALLLRLRPLPGMTTTGETAANLAAVISCCFCWRKVSWLLPQRDARGVQWVSGKGGMKWVKEKKGPVKMTFTWIQKRGLLKKEEEKKRKGKGNGREKELVFSRIFISNFFFFFWIFFFNSSYVSQKIIKKRIDCIIRSTCTSFIAQFQRTLSPGYVVISVFGDLFMPFEPAVNTSTSNSCCCCCCCHVKTTWTWLSCMLYDRGLRNSIVFSPSHPFIVIALTVNNRQWLLVICMPFAFFHPVDYCFSLSFIIIIIIDIFLLIAMRCTLVTL